MSLWTPNPLLQPVRHLQPEIDKVYQRCLRHIQDVVEGAEVQLVGSSALAPAYSSGTLDLEVLVDAEAVAPAQKLLDESTVLHTQELAVHCCVRDRHKPNRNLAIRQYLANNPLLLGELIGIQKAHAHSTNSSYEEAKEEFYSQLELDLEKSHHTPYQIRLETERLDLVTPLCCDTDEYCRYLIRNRDYHAPWTPRRDESYYQPKGWMDFFADEAMKRWRKEALTFLLRKKEDDRIIGSCHFSGFVWGPFRSCYLGYNGDQKHEGQGLVREALQRAIDFVFEDWGVHRIAVNYMPDNERSARLAHSLGFQVEGQAKFYLLIDGKWSDHVLTAQYRDAS